MVPLLEFLISEDYQMIWRILLGAGAGFLFSQFCAAVADASMLIHSVDWFYLGDINLYKIAPVAVGGLMCFAWHKLKQET
jgi:hypothetical protein